MLIATGDNIALPFDPSELAPAPSGPLGPMLRATREASGRTLDDVSRATRIGAHYLAALEDERLGDFAARVYAIGFAATYARELGLPGEWAQDQVREQIDRHPPSWRRSGWYT